MAHLSRNRTKLIAGAVIATAGGMSAVSSASPYVNVVMLGKDISTGGATFVSNIPVVNVGDTIVYQVLAFLAPTGTTNANGVGTGKTLTTKTNNSSGMNSLSIDAYQLTSDDIQVNFKNAVAAGTTVSSGVTTTTSPAEGISLTTSPATSSWKNGTGALGGHLGHQTSANLPGARTGPNNDLLIIRPVQSPGTFRGLTSTQAIANLGTGLFVVASLGGDTLTPVRLRYTPAGGGQGGFSGGVRINDGGTANDTFNLSDAEEAGTNAAADPLVSYTGMTLGPIPEPGSLSLLGLAAAGLLIRRKNKA